MPDTVIAALDLFDRTCLRLTEGQYLDIRFEAEENVTIESYLKMVEGKTAALLAAACELGALVADATPAQREHLHQFGRHLGLGFQIQDDILGIWGDPQVTGKPASSDILQHKKTLPILHGLRQSEPLHHLLAQPDLTPDDAARAAAMLEASGSRDWTADKAREQIEAALEALDQADVRGPAADGLRELAQGLSGRNR